MKNSEILVATNWRRAIKKYTDKKIAKKDWDFLLEVARLAPTSYGLEPWNILDIENRKIREKIKIAFTANEAKFDADKFIIFTVKKDLGADSKYFREVLKSHGFSAATRLVYMNIFKKFAKNQQDLTSQRKLEDWAGKQAYIAMGQMIFAAAEIKIDSTPLEGFNKNQLNEILAENGVLDTEKDVAILACAFGFRDDKNYDKLNGKGFIRFPKVRRPIEEVVKKV